MKLEYLLLMVGVIALIVAGYTTYQLVFVESPEKDLYIPVLTPFFEELLIKEKEDKEIAVMP